MESNTVYSQDKLQQKFILNWILKVSESLSKNERKPVSKLRMAVNLGWICHFEFLTIQITEKEVMQTKAILSDMQISTKHHLVYCVCKLSVVKGMDGSLWEKNQI